MSMKVYDAFRVTDPGADVFAVSARLHEIITPVFRRLRTELVVRATAGVIDDAGRGRPAQHADPLPFQQARKAWLAQQQQADPSHVWHDPLRFEASIARAGDRLLVKLFCGERGYVEAICADTMFEDYAYWDNADRPEQISKEQWGRRRADWDLVCHLEHAFAHLPSWALANTLGQTFSPAPMMEQGLDLDAVVSPRSRLAQQIESEVFRELFESLPREQAIPRVMGLSIDARRFTRTLVERIEDSDPWLPAPLPPLSAPWSQIELPTWPSIVQIRERAASLGVALPGAEG